MADVAIVVPTIPREIMVARQERPRTAPTAGGMTHGGVVSMSAEQDTCECGCGRQPKPGRRYLHGHNGHHNRGRRFIKPGRVPTEVLTATELQIAWAAGLYEGEGSVIVEDRVGPRTYASPRMAINSTDRDVIERLHVLLGGRVSFEPQSAPNRKDQWKWIFQGYEAVVALNARLQPWLCARRSARLNEVLAHCANVRAQVAERS